MNIGLIDLCRRITEPLGNCINMVYVSPVRGGKAEIIEDILLIYNIGVSLKLAKLIIAVRQELSGEKLEFT